MKNSIALTLCVGLLILHCATSMAQDTTKKKLDSTLKLRFTNGEGIHMIKKSALEMEKIRLQIEFLFQNKTDQQQMYQRSEYEYRLFDEEGEEIDTVIFPDVESKTIVLRDRSTSDQPDLSISSEPFKRGNSFLLYGRVRNLAGIVKLKVSAE